MKRLLGPILLIALVLGVAAGIFLAIRQQVTSRRVVHVRGLIGSEKESFFQDPRVGEALRKGGLEVQVEKAGSRQIATSYDLNQYDFAFPAGVPAAEKIRREQGGSRSYDVFFTPMAVASWLPIAQLLGANGLAEAQGGTYALDMTALLRVMEDEVQWSELEDNTVYPVNKGILITSTDVRKSNSAAMYLSLASFVANGNRVVQSEAESTPLMPFLESLFLRQGYVEYSSAVPFEDYLAMGMGKAPLVMIYEAQFLAAAANGVTSADMVLLYPEPTIYSKHVLVAWTEGGQRLGELLKDDPVLQELAIEYGFRNSSVSYFADFTAGHQLDVPDTIVNVVEPPSYEVLEGMIQRIEQRY